MSRTRDVISKYYEILRKGIESGIMHVDQFPFHDDVHIFTQNFHTSGKKEVFALYQDSIHVMKTLEIKELFASEESACAIVEITLFKSPARILSADWFQLKEGKIEKIHLIYDSAAWEKIIQT